MTEELYSLHLLGATGVVRSEMYEGRSHFVVPIVALMEGVIHAVNAADAEFVPSEVLDRAANSFNGRPVVIHHPVKNGRQCSANSPDVLATSVGLIFNSRTEGKKLLQEAWIDKGKVLAANRELHDRLAAGKPEEVSVGALVVTGGGAGEHNGKRYKASWLSATGDHLAILPGGRGACSMEMGCGAHRAAAHLVTAEGFIPLVTEVFLTLKDKSLDERMYAVNRAVDKRWNESNMPAIQAGAPYTGIEKVFDDRVIIRQGEKFFLVPYTVKDEAVVLGEPKEVTQKWVAASAARMKDCPACKGSGNTGNNPCEACEGSGELKAASISTPPAKKAITTPAAAKPQPRAAGCGCNEVTPCGCHKGVPAMTRAELIASLVTDKFSGFKDGDEPILEAASDARLEELRAAADAHRAIDRDRTKQTTELTNANARLKIAEERLRTAQESPSEEEWLAKAPPSIKTLIDAHKAEEDALRGSLVSRLKDCGANTEAELKAMPLDQLKTLAAYARVEIPDFSGRGIPVERNAAANTSYAPPDPYAEGLKALRSKMVN